MRNGRGEVISMSNPLLDVTASISGGAASVLYFLDGELIPGVLMAFVAVGMMYSFLSQ